MILMHQCGYYFLLNIAGHVPHIRLLKIIARKAFSLNFGKTARLDQNIEFCEEVPSIGTDIESDIFLLVSKKAVILAQLSV